MTSTFVASTGLIYVATGARYVQEAEAACARVKTVMPHLPVTLFTDKPVQSASFEQIILLEKPRYQTIDKVLGLQQSPYERTLFLDTDTYVLEDISDIFAILDQFDVAVVHSPQRGKRNWEGWQRVPYGFSQFNSGVIAVKRSAATDALLDDWRQLYDDHLKQADRQADVDQPALREALYRSSVRMMVLPPEYNFRTTVPGICQGPMKILHGRHRRIAEFAERINQTTNLRMIRIKGDRLSIETFQAPLWLQAARKLKQAWRGSRAKATPRLETVRPEGADGV